MRGKHSVRVLLQQRIGITPADAGKTTTRKAKHRAVQDHPRGCGENPVSCASVKHAPGSPPRMRGKLRYNLAKVIQIRITPADAGKTSAAKFFRVRCGDHPRGCGENAGVNAKPRHSQGSPPRMRGKRCQDRKQNRRPRITPADAGKTVKPVYISAVG